MKNDNIFIIISISIYFVLLGIIYSIGFHEVNIDWDNISGTILGVYLYFTYLFLGSIFGKSEKQMPYTQRKVSSGNNQKSYSNEAYKY